MDQEEEPPIRVGLIGYGYVGKTFHAPLVRSVPGLALTIVASSRPEVVFADIPEAHVLADPIAVVTHPELDLIVIASPNESHYPLTAAALRAGKHVVCDKPFTLTLAEAEALARLAQEQGKLLSVFHNRRWDSEVLATRAVIASGILGRDLVAGDAHRPLPGLLYGSAGASRPAREPAFGSIWDRT